MKGEILALKHMVRPARNHSLEKLVSVHRMDICIKKWPYTISYAAFQSRQCSLRWLSKANSSGIMTQSKCQGVGTDLVVQTRR